MIAKALPVLALFLLTGSISVTTGAASTGEVPHVRDPEIFRAGFFSDLIDELSYDPDVRIVVANIGLQTLSGKGPSAPYPQSNALAVSTRLVALVAREGVQSGMDPHYLVRLAKRESDFDPFATSPTSTAFGLFQFTENTWLCSLKDFGPGLGVQGSITIRRDRRGVCETSEPSERSRLLALRSDATLSTRIAAAFSLSNYRLLSMELGRRPSVTELYMLHFFGQDVGLRFLRTYSLRPAVSAFSVAPAAASANANIFFTETGQPRSVREVFDRLRLAGVGRI